MFAKRIFCVFKAKMSQTINRSYQATNEPILAYLDGSPEKIKLFEKIEEFNKNVQDVPIVIGDDHIKNDKIVKYQIKPFEKTSPLAVYYYADESQINKAIESNRQAFKSWEATPLEKRADIFIKAASLIRGKYRADLLAATMLGQAKTIYQAEIDTACELADFFNFNAEWALQQQWKPLDAPGITNNLIWRGLEGFWAAISPFNFTAIGGHLAGAPAFMGNVVIWKPSDTSILSSYVVYKILREAGLPPGVINFVPSDGETFGKVITGSPYLAGVNFTGSQRTFETIWKNVGANISNYKSFPRLIGECGGKNYHLIHPSYNSSEEIQNAALSTIRSAFEYGGQKCSACSRLYVPNSLWPEFKRIMIQEMKKIKIGSPVEIGNFLSAVIDQNAFKKISNYVDFAKAGGELEIICGGNCDDSVGYFIEPTLIETKNPLNRLMTEEIFGPILTVFVFADNEFDEIINVIDKSTPYALTGAIFCNDMKVLTKAQEGLRFSAGNFYINDKCTGAVVAQQPFGGARKSGTNDKAGSPFYVQRFANLQAIKVQHEKLNRWDYDYMKK